MSTIPFRFAWLLVLGITLGSGVARAQSKEDVEARSHFRLARAHYENGAFLKAAEEFQNAYEVSGRPQLLYNIYLAYRDANVQDKAAEALRGYLDEAEDVPNRPQLEARLAALERGLQDDAETQEADETREEAEPGEGAEPAAAEEAREPGASAPAPRPAQAEPSALRMDSDASSGGSSKVLPITLMAAGGALIASAVITGVMASSAQSDLEDGCANPAACDPELESTRDRGQALAVATDVLWISGAVAAGAGLTLFLLGSSDEEHASAESLPRASMGCSPTGCGGMVEMTF